MALCEQVEAVGADAIVQFKASQSFIDACAVYYCDRFNDCLKQVGTVYPNLDLSKVTMDDPLPMAPAGGNTVNKVTNDFTHTEQGLKDDGVVFAQPALERPVTPVIPSIENPPLEDAEEPFC